MIFHLIRLSTIFVNAIKEHLMLVREVEGGNRIKIIIVIMRKNENWK